jgi:hypothetical protein
MAARVERRRLDREGEAGHSLDDGGDMNARIRAATGRGQ